MATVEQGRASPPGEPTGGANPPGEPLRLAEDGSPHLLRLAEDGSPHHSGELQGGASPLGEPQRLAEDGSPHPPGEPTNCQGQGLPARRKLPHGLPPFPVLGPIVQFVTINAAERGGTPFLAVAEKMLDAARFYHEHGRWFLSLFLVMPDHLHMLATFPSGSGKATCGAWKGFLRKTLGIRFQSDCFEHRIRNESEFAEKWHYIRENPVRKGLVDMPDEWPYWIAFGAWTGRQIGGLKGRASPQGEPTGGANLPGEPTGGVSPLGEPLRLAEDGSPHHLRLAEDGSPHLSGGLQGRASPLGEPTGGVNNSSWRCSNGEQR